MDYQVVQKRELKTLRARVDGARQLLGESATMGRLRETIRLAAPSKGRVLITGESGTGKELIARAIHDQSNLSHLARRMAAGA